MLEREIKRLEGVVGNMRRKLGSLTREGEGCLADGEVGRSLGDVL